MSEREVMWFTVQVMVGVRAATQREAQQKIELLFDPKADVGLRKEYVKDCRHWRVVDYTRHPRRERG